MSTPLENTAPLAASDILDAESIIATFALSVRAIEAQAIATGAQPDWSTVVVSSGLGEAPEPTPSSPTIRIAVASTTAEPLLAEHPVTVTTTLPEEISA